jgi:hypothetical protein
LHIEDRGKMRGGKEDEDEEEEKDVRRQEGRAEVRRMRRRNSIPHKCQI